jgi:hypothetical protein
MRLSMSTLVAAAALWAPAPALAQGAATDNELYAAYCIGVMNSSIEDMGGPSSNPQIEQMRQTTIAPLVQSRQRFQSYLISSGVITDYRRADAILGLATATQRGQADQQQCLAGIMANCHPEAECKVGHGAKPNDPLAGC